MENEKPNVLYDWYNFTLRTDARTLHNIRSEKDLGIIIKHAVGTHSAILRPIGRVGGFQLVSNGHVKPFTYNRKKEILSYILDEISLSELLELEDIDG